MTQQPFVDPYETVEYAKFVQSMAEHCHCASPHCPCDGVLAGGVCDNIQERTEDSHEDNEEDDT